MRELQLIVGILEQLMEASPGDFQKAPNPYSSGGQGSAHLPAQTSSQTPKLQSLAAIRRNAPSKPKEYFIIFQVPTAKQDDGVSCGLFTIHFVKEILLHWPPPKALFRERKTLLWLQMSTATVERDRRKLLQWAFEALPNPFSWGRFPSEEHGGDPEQLQVAREVWYSRFVHQHLNLDPSAWAQVQVQDPPSMDVGTDPIPRLNVEYGDKPIREDNTLGCVLAEITCPETSRRLSALSLPTQRLSPSLEKLQSTISDTLRAISRAQLSSQSTPTESAHDFPFFGLASAIETLGFSIVSAHGSTHAGHFDFSGLHTVLQPQVGYKAVLMAWPLKDGVGVPPNLPSASFTVLLETEGLGLALVVLGPSDTLIMPAGTRRMVLTVAPSGEWKSPCIMQGFFFDFYAGFYRLVEALILHSVWYDQWTNGGYRRRLDLLAFLLAQQLEATDVVASHGRNYYSLLYAAKYSQLLRPGGIPQVRGWQKVSSSDLPAIKYLTTHGLWAIGQLKGTDALEYAKVEEQLNAFLQAELQTRLITDALDDTTTPPGEQATMSASGYNSEEQDEPLGPGGVEEEDELEEDELEKEEEDSGAMQLDLSSHEASESEDETQLLPRQFTRRHPLRIESDDDMDETSS
ncbi:hypothetical protein DL93DRAFT_240138 [Clavulina sp. PMI_390]|nr:hypothetical protein DL93DRAFT_240138 [Clavulina sp. PMI_390]